MAEIRQFKYSMHELAEMLVKHEGLTEGKWMLSVEFGISATNVGRDDENLTPAALIPIVNIGLVESERANNLTIDASKIKSQK